MGIAWGIDGPPIDIMYLDSLLLFGGGFQSGPAHYSKLEKISYCRNECAQPDRLCD